MKDRRNSFEDDVLQLLKQCLPTERCPRVVVLADRGFGDVALYAELEEELGFEFVIRFRKNVMIEHGTERKRADEWLAAAGGRSVQLRDVKMTGRFHLVANFVAVHEPKMKEPWFLASSMRGSIKAITSLYARRFTIEETFRDQKDMRFGWALYDVNVTQPLRRDRLLFLAALAQLLLTLLGAAGERMGLDAKLRVNTVTKRRTPLAAAAGPGVREGTRGQYCESDPRPFPRAVRRAFRRNGNLCACLTQMRGCLRDLPALVEATILAMSPHPGVQTSIFVNYLSRTDERLALSSFYDRFTWPFAELMQSLAWRSIEAVREATPEDRRRRDLGVLLKEFRDVQVVDSSTHLLKRLARHWAPSTSKVKPAGVKWHAVVSLKDGVPVAERLTEQKLHDSAGLPEGALAAGTLTLFDLGYRAGLSRERRARA